MSLGSASLIAAAQRLGGNGGDDVEVRDLFERVHAGVGPPGAVQLELLLRR